MKRLTIDPITRLEGHGRIDLFVGDDGQVDAAYLVIPELRGFEKFLEGRPVEELPIITPRICGVCPEAHHLASAKAADAVFGLEIPQAAELIRHLRYNAFMAGDHATHFFALGGPDIIMGPGAAPAERNVIGVLNKVGDTLGGAVLRMRSEGLEVAELLGGRRIHAVGLLPGGVSKAVDRDTAGRLMEIGYFMVQFAETALGIFNKLVLEDEKMLAALLADEYQSVTSYLALVDAQGRFDPMGEKVRVVGPDGAEILTYDPADYLEHIAEHVEPWSYLKFPYLKQTGWQGLGENAAPSIVRTGPLGSLNASMGMQTPRAQAEYERFYETLGGKPVHATMAYHWARLIELMQCAEQVQLLASDERLLDPNVRAMPDHVVGEGVGTIEAPRGLLTHHYKTDENGIVTSVNMIVGTTYNYPGIQLSVRKAARTLLQPGAEITEELMNRIEMSFRAYDPCFGCATHALPGSGPLEIRTYGPDGSLRDSLRRDEYGHCVHLAPGEGGRT